MDRLKLTIMKTLKLEVYSNAPYVRKTLILQIVSPGWSVSISIPTVASVLMECSEEIGTSVQNVDKLSLQATKIFISVFCLKISAVLLTKSPMLAQLRNSISLSIQTINITNSSIFSLLIHSLKDLSTLGMAYCLMKSYQLRGNSSFVLKWSFLFIIISRLGLSICHRKCKREKCPIKESPII